MNSNAKMWVGFWFAVALFLSVLTICITWGATQSDIRQKEIIKTCMDKGGNPTIDRMIGFTGCSK